VLACAALNPRLRSVIVLGSAHESTLDSAAEVAGHFLEVVDHARPVTVRLSAADTDEDLWGGLAFVRDADQPNLVWRASRLAVPAGDARTRIVVIPDLSRLSQSGQRALVALLDAPDASLQRNGLNLHWTPHVMCIAGCAREAIGQVSAHVLDRFAVRLAGPFGDQRLSPPELYAYARGEPPRRPGETRDQKALVARLRRAVRHHAPTFEPHALEQVLARTQYPRPGEGARRDLALARLAIAHARLLGARTVTPEVVDAAAELIRLPREPARQGESLPSPRADASAPAPLPNELSTIAPSTARSEVVALPTSRAGDAEIVVIRSTTSVQFETLPATVERGPYPEDATPATRGAESLRMPLRARRAHATTAGPPIGTRPATDADLRDLALVATVVEAARFRAARATTQSDSGLPGPLRISTSDLRSYVRASLPEQLLVLVLDYTSFGDRDWETALLPHLRWAYQERAAVRLIRVGAAKTADPLRADSMAADNVLAQRLASALVAGAASATPLAHGLDLALRAVREALQHGRGSTQEARLVVLTDARGNVPLATSRTGQLTDGLVGRQGIDDALRIARLLRAQRHVNGVVLDPRPREYADLPAVLADALGASVEMVP
jgi:magnesium chelatase subunit D